MKSFLHIATNGGTKEHSTRERYGNQSERQHCYEARMSIESLTTFSITGMCVHFSSL